MRLTCPDNPVSLWAALPRLAIPRTPAADRTDHKPRPRRRRTAASARRPSADRVRFHPPCRPGSSTAPPSPGDLVDDPQGGQPLVGAASPGAGHHQGARAHPVPLDALERRVANVEGVASPLGHDLADPARAVVALPQRRDLEAQQGAALPAPQTAGVQQVGEGSVPAGAPAPPAVVLQPARQGSTRPSGGTRIGCRSRSPRARSCAARSSYPATG